MYVGVHMCLSMYKAGSNHTVKRPSVRHSLQGSATLTAPTLPRRLVAVTSSAMVATSRKEQ